MDFPYARAALIWLADAEQDLALAHYLIAHPGPTAPWQVAFHGQQACEKSLKAVLAFARAEHQQHGHDLNLLLAALPAAGWTVRARYADLREISAYAVTTRYRITGAVVTAAQAERAVRLAAGLIRACRVDLKRHGLVIPPPQD